MLPIIHPHPPNRKTTRNDETPKYSPPQQHSTLTRTSPCTTHETNPTPTEYRNPLTHNNIQNTQKTSLITPPHDPAPPPHTTQPEPPPRRHPKTPAPHTPPTTTPGTCHHRRSNTKHQIHPHQPNTPHTDIHHPTRSKGRVITPGQKRKTNHPTSRRETPAPP